MPLSLFEKMISEAREMGVESLGLHFNGESVLHPEFPRMLMMSRGIRTNFSTNGIDITDDVIGAILDARIRKVNFSIHVAGDQPMLAAARLKRARDRRGKRRPIISASYCYNGEPDDRIRAIWSQWHNAVDTFGLSGTVEDMKWKALPPYGKTVVNRARCQQPLRYAAVLWDGRVTVCCHDLGGELASGDVSSKRLIEVLTEPHFVNIRQHIMENKIPDYPLCRRCQLWNSRYRFPPVDFKEKT